MLFTPLLALFSLFGLASAYCHGINAAGIALIKKYEGFVPNVYTDPTGNPTVGYGHLCQSKGCSEVKYKFPLTEATGTKLLEDDIPTYTACVASHIHKPLNANQFAALTSFTFNLGCGNLASSSLAKRINAGENPNTVAEQEFPKWVHGGGKVLPGLVKRRAAEVALFKTASSHQSSPGCT